MNVVSSKKRLASHQSSRVQRRGVNQGLTKPRLQLNHGGQPRESQGAVCEKRRAANW